MKRAAIAVLTIVIVAACSSPQSDEPVEELFNGTPTFEWTRTSPADAGFDPAKLAEVITETDEHRSACFVVVKDGELVVEEYWRGETVESNRPVFSITKSVASTLVGIAQDDGDLTIDEPVAEYVDEWAGGPSADVTIRHLLANDSGRDWSPTIDYNQLIGTENRSQFSIDLGQSAEPGTVWAYNNAAIQVLDRVLLEATDTRPYEMGRDRLFEPLGMQYSRMSSDASGQSTGTAFGLLSTCLDVARFGLLFEQRGKWLGEQIVSEAWIDEAIGQPSQDLNAAYGLLWWLNRPGPVREALDPGSSRPPIVQPREQLVPGAPDDMYAAMGFGGQILLIDPGSRTIVVRLGDPNVDGVMSTYDFADAARVVTHALN